MDNVRVPHRAEMIFQERPNKCNFGRGFDVPVAGVEVPSKNPIRR